MPSNYLTILQLHQAGSREVLDYAYKRSQERYLRLTSRGPLKFYRHDLLKATDEAYRALKRGERSDSDDPSERRSRLLEHRPISLLSRQLGGREPVKRAKPPVRSTVKEGSILSNAHTVRARQAGVQLSDDAAKRKQRAVVEDGFCREVIFRLEGDLIRYDSRRELLKLAKEMEIPAFRANLLMAQIVEAVRQNKLYLPSEKEKKQKQIYVKSMEPAGAAEQRKRFYIAATITVLITIVVDVLLFMLIGKKM